VPCLEDGRVLSQRSFEDAQWMLRLQAPRCAARALPGSVVHLAGDEDAPMRRPLSIMRADVAEGWLEVLYQELDPGLAALARRRAGDPLSLLGPIGRGFVADPARPRPLLVGDGVGIAPLVFLAESLLDDRRAAWQPLVLVGAETPFPFRARPSTILVPGMPAGTIACMPLLDGWGVPSRLASRAGRPGCFDGGVTALADAWLGSLDAAARSEVQVFASGPRPMLEVTAALARRHALPCQVSLAETLACATGDCASCTVRIVTPEGPVVQRACVEGPVFDAAAVFPA
jgi:dihydroorotate dehydrogenase electron transfer subunit